MASTPAEAAPIPPPTFTVWDIVWPTKLFGLFSVATTLSTVSLDQSPAEILRIFSVG